VAAERPEADYQDMLEKFLNIFRIPDLRKRVLFTLGILAVYRLGAFIPTPGVNTSTSWSCLFNSAERLGIGPDGLVRRRQPAPHDHLRPGHHALHHRLHHLSASDRGL
jgi:hypothetical protein